jgi:glycine/D-amino acid oxidase-like deaminating enzyme
MQARLRLDAAGGLKLRDGFMLDPYRACLGLVAESARRRVACFERSHVRKVRFNRRSAEVVTEGGTIQARKVVIATGTVTAEFKPLQRHLERRETYFAITEPVPAAMRRQLGDPRVVLTDVAVPLTLTWTRDNRLIVAGADQRETPARLASAVLTQRTGQLMYEVLKRYPAILGLQPEYSWQSVYGRTADGLMYIGAHRNYPHQLFAVGGSAIDLTGAFVAARVLVRAIRGAAEKGDELFGWTR